MKGTCAAVALSMCATAALAGKRGADTSNVESPRSTKAGRSASTTISLKGRQVALNAIFTTCKDVCPLETANMVQLRKVLGERAGREVHLYSITVDPKRDTPEVLKAYAEKFGADWTFLTGRPEDIKAIMKKLALIRERDDPTSARAITPPI